MIDLNTNIKENKILVVGLARSGKAAAEALRSLGAEVDVYDAKLKPLGFTFSEKHTPLMKKRGFGQTG